ncbi:Ig-like domain-containing protein [Streptomyces sp. NPDC002851]
MRQAYWRRGRARAGIATVLAGAGLVVTAAAGLTGCSGGLDAVVGKGEADQAIRVSPGHGERSVSAEQGLKVSVPHGRLQSVKVVKLQDARKTPVPGRISPDGLRWEPDDKRLALAAQYAVHAVALDGHGRRQARHSTFRTYVPDERFVGYVTPEHRSTVGTGMIVSLEFNREIENRAAVERAVRVTAEPAVEVVGHWLGKSRLDFRPKEYWKPGTEVTVDLGLRDVEGAPGVYGRQQKRITFTVGRSQVSRVDAEKHTMEVRRDGELVSTVPITAGGGKNTTYNGQMVITEMLDVTRMNGATVGFTDSDGKGEYDIPDVPHAIRLTTSGTFLHGNYWAPPSTFGRENVSHGCVGLRDVKGGSEDAPAGWFFDRSLIGDVVEVVNSPDKTVAPDNGLGGWNLNWQKWRAGSALHG